MDCIFDYLFFFKKKIKENFKKLFYFFTFIIFLFGIFLLNKYLNEKKNKKVILALSEIFERYEALIRDNSFLTLNEFINEIETIYKENKNSFLSNNFLIIKSSILAIQGKEDEFLKNFKLIKNEKFNNSKIIFLYKLSTSIYLLKSKNKENQKLGEIYINECINEKKNKLHEAAIFYYGLHKLHNLNLIEADKIWNLLKKNPYYKYSPYKNLIEKARNWDF